MIIKVDDLQGPEIAQLLTQHLQHMASLSPPESTHALDIEALQQEDVVFWSAWQDDELMGCGALKRLNARHGEIKSMRTVDAHRRKGVAGKVLQHIIVEARGEGYKRLSLETGSMEGFKSACKLYEAFGFSYCPPFGDYIEDPNSVFMTLAL